MKYPVLALVLAASIACGAVGVSPVPERGAPPDLRGSIAGQVLDPFDQPVAGVRVMLRRRDAVPEDAIWKRPGATFPGDGVAEPPFDTPIEVVTGPDGRFEFDGLAPGIAAMSASAVGHSVTLRPETWAPVRVAGGFEVMVPVLADARPFEVRGTARPLRAVEMDVRLPDGSVPEAALVVVAWPDRGPMTSPGRQQVWRPGAPELWFAAEELEVSVYAEPVLGWGAGLRSETARFAANHVDVGPRVSGSGATARVELRRRTGLIVETERVDPLTAGTRLVPAADWPDVDDRTHRRSSVAFDSEDVIGAASIANRLLFLGASPGEYVLAGHPRLDGAPSPVHARISLVEGEVQTLTLDLPEVGEQRLPRVVAVDPAGQRLEVADASWYRRPGRPEGPPALRVECPGHGQRVVPVSDGQEEIRVVFDPPAHLRLRRTDGLPFSELRNVQVSLSGVPEISPGTGASRRVGPREGVGEAIDLRYLTPGTYDLRVHARRIATASRRDLLRETVQIESGQNEVILDLPRLHSFRLSAPGAVPADFVRIVGPLEGPLGRGKPPLFRVQFGEDAAAVVDLLRPGRYEIRRNPVHELPGAEDTGEAAWSFSGALEVTVPLDPDLYPDGVVVLDE